MKTLYKCRDCGKMVRYYNADRCKPCYEKELNKICTMIDEINEEIKHEGKQ